MTPKPQHTFTTATALFQSLTLTDLTKHREEIKAELAAVGRLIRMVRARDRKRTTKKKKARKA